MGSPPPVNFPAPTAPAVPTPPTIPGQSGFSGGVSFAPAPSGLLLCGFGIPLFQFNLGFRIPKFPPFPFPPTFAFFLALNCDLSDPIDAHFAYGGGRVPNVAPGDPEDV